MQSENKNSLNACASGEIGVGVAVGVKEGHNVTECEAVGFQALLVSVGMIVGVSVAEGCGDGVSVGGKAVGVCVSVESNILTGARALHPISTPAKKMSANNINPVLLFIFSPRL